MTDYEMLLEAERRQLQSIRDAFALMPDMDMALLGWHGTMRELGVCCGKETGVPCCIERLLNKGYVTTEPLQTQKEPATDAGPAAGGRASGEAAPARG